MNDPFHEENFGGLPSPLPMVMAGGGGAGADSPGGGAPGGDGGSDGRGDRGGSKSLLEVFNSLSTDEQEEILLALSQMLGERKELRGLMAAYSAQRTSKETESVRDEDPKD